MKRVIGLIFLICCLSASSFGQAFVICQAQPDVDPESLAVRYGLVFLDKTDNHPFFFFAAPSADYAYEVEEWMEDDSDIVWAEEDTALNTPENQVFRAPIQKGSTLPAVGGRDTLYAQNTHILQQVGFSPELANSSGRSVRIAVLDTGLAPQLTYLWDSVVASTNFVEEGQPAYDQPLGTESDGDGVVDGGTGHGSMVAGLVDQVAPKVGLVVVRVADSDGIATVWTIIKGLVYAVDQGCEVANVSFGSRRKLPSLKYIADWCDDNRLLVVAPVGNNNSERICYPAAISEYISVAGVLPDNIKAPFSNYNERCDFSAPATGIASAWWDGDWATWSGTSLASPLVAGLVADCLRRTWRMSPWRIRERVRKHGLALGQENPEYAEKLGVLVNHQIIDDRFHEELP